MRRAVEFFLGGASVYVMVAACAGGEGREREASPNHSASSSQAVTVSGNVTSAGGRNGAGGSEGAGGAGVGGSGQMPPPTDASLVDRMMNPVPDVDAQPSTVQVDDVPCSGADGGWAFAEKSYPGSALASLTKVVALGAVVPSASAVIPSGYQFQQTTAWVKDGAVAVWCGPASMPFYSSIRFVRHT